jgi:hypothetical protein
MIFGIASKTVYERDMSERDCLSLNIYMPTSALDSYEALPVCVWIYGGGFKNGSITHPLYGKHQSTSLRVIVRGGTEREVLLEESKKKKRKTLTAFNLVNCIS